MPQRSLREQIVEGAARVLCEKGFHEASVSDIAAAASVPKGSLFNHFANKEALAVEVLRRYANEFEFDLLLSADGPPTSRLRAFFAAAIETTVTRGVEFGCLLGNLSLEMAAYGGPLADQAAKMWDQWCSACAETVRAAQEAGELRADVDPDTIGAWLVGAYEGAVIHAKLIRDRRPLDDFMAITFDGPVPFIVALA